MTTYYARLASIPNTSDFTQVFVFGSVQLSMRFYWPQELQDEYDLYARALDVRAKADPFIKGIEIIRDFDYLTMYCDTIPHATQQEVEAWVASTGMLPQSLKSLYEAQPYLACTKLYEACMEAEAIREQLKPYIDQLVWHIEVSDAQDNIVTGVVRQMGWLNNQSPDWRIQFESEHQLGRDELELLTINCEVADDSAI